MKKTILFIAILLGIIASSVTTVNAQCANARVHNRTAFDMYVTIYDQCSGSTGAVLVPSGLTVVIPMPSATCAMLSGNIYYPSVIAPPNPCAGNHPICPPSGSPCTICSFPNQKTVTTTITPLIPSGCEYDIDII
jgi:hypothetical protein